jgi:hypothetical protein
MTDEQFLGHLARVPSLPDSLRTEVGRRQMKLAQQRVHAGRLARTGVVSEDDPGAAGSLDAHTAGAVALARAVRHPGRWVRLPRGRSAKAWRAAIAHAVKQIENKFDAGLAGTLAPELEQGQGTHLRTTEDDRGALVEILWQPGLGGVGQG